MSAFPGSAAPLATRKTLPAEWSSMAVVQKAPRWKGSAHSLFVSLISKSDSLAVCLATT